MRKLIVTIIILLIIFVGMIIYRNMAISSSNQVSVQEIEQIETYITKIYMWREVTNEALPTFENINEASDMWTWEVVKKNLEDYELEYEVIDYKQGKKAFLNFIEQYNLSYEHNCISKINRLINSLSK